MKNSTLGQALFIVNRHAKTATNPKKLYQLKKTAIEKLIREKKAKKIGLHFTDNPKHSVQHSTLLVEIDHYYFHVPPTKEDFKELKHLGSLDKNYRNPKVHMSLSKSTQILCNYLGWSYDTYFNEAKRKRPQENSKYAVPTSSLSPFYHKRKK
ncbi:YkyB family protein [Saliterribacillus persicus]|uniref:YkyB-like protein n=1 Tax=Saliterribacillus persicus TaxID=930114 RepID=A0A368XV46_9BACI|nr:YkyB family protein [Saliterribacillus persicus]RCW71843.1 YkyB-like protein [Saliterribacillus persicus]